MAHRPIDNILNIDDVKRTADHLGSFFFTPGAMRFFNSRAHDTVYPTSPSSGYFVTSERFEDNPRTYTVRTYRVFTNKDGKDLCDIDTADGHHMNHTTSRSAHAAAANLAKEDNQ